MRRIALSLVVVLLLDPAVFGGPFQKERVAADAKWVAHLDAEALLASQTGQFILKQLQAQGLDAKLREFIEKAGFDPTKDLKSVTLYGTDFGKESGVAVIQAVLDKDKLLALLAKNEGHKESKYGDVAVHQWTEKRLGQEATRFGCFVGDDLTVIATSEELLQAAVDVLNKKKDSLAKGGGPSILPAPAAGSVLLAAGEGFVVPDKTPRAAMLKKIQAAALELGEADKKIFARVCLVTKEAKDADDIRKMVEGLVALGSMIGQGAEDPKGPQAELAGLLQAVQVAVKDNAVTVSVSWDVDVITALMEKLAALQHKTPAGKAPAAP